MPSTRIPLAGLIASIALLAHPSRSEAQAGPLAFASPLPGEPVRWGGSDPSTLVRTSDGACHEPADSVDTRTSNVFLVLEEREAAYPTVSRLLLTYIAQDIASALMRSEPTADGRSRLLPADDAYPPSMLLSRATFTLLRDGTLADVDLSSVLPDAFRAALRGAFDSIAARGGVGGFDARGKPPAIPIALRLDTKIDTTRGVAPLFTLKVPLDRVARALPSNSPPPFPADGQQRGAEAHVLLTYIVDTNGRVRGESIRSVDVDPGMPAEHARLFELFERAARRSVVDYQFRPAAYLGCRVPMWVVQPFNFKLRR